LTGVSLNDVAVDHFECVQAIREAGVFLEKAEKVVALDFVTNSRRTEHEAGRQLKGSAQKKTTRAPVVYTDSYLVPVTLDGKRL
jgi:hypothetical protein